LGEDFDEVSAGSDAQNPTQNKWHQFIDNDDVFSGIEFL
jgi:hypothetical protein